MGLALRAIKNINLQETRIGPAGAAVLVYALISGSLSHLQSLDLTHIGDEATRDILQALADSCPDLRRIDLNGMGASSQALGAFHEALASDVWPRLGEIKVCYDYDEVAGDLMSTLAVTGVGTSLRRMELYWPCDQRVMVHRLARVLQQGACPSLRVLHFHGVYRIPRSAD